MKILSIQWRGHQIPVRYREKPGVSLSYRGGEVYLSLHDASEADQALALMDRHKVWLERRLGEVQARQQNEQEDCVLIEGVRYPIVQDGEHCGVVGDAFHSPSSFATHAWLLREAQKRLLPVLQQCAASMQVRYRSVHFAFMVSKWGSNSGSGRNTSRLHLNACLVCVPPELARYVLVHELAHDYQRNHSAAFWKVVERYCPDYVRLRRTLHKQYGYLPRKMKL